MNDLSIDLSAFGQSIDGKLSAGKAEEAAALARIVLQRLPRHLPTYQRLVHATWLLKRWQEGEDWSRRLLQADPGNAVAWRSLAYSVEQKALLTTARAMWKRAFEADAYDPDIRVGLSRTSLERPDALALDAACLAGLYLRGARWSHAAAAYQALVQADERRVDFQVNWAVALWQQNARREAYKVARHLTRQNPHLLMAWVVIHAVGDVDDRALARSPIAAMDPDGEFVRAWLGLPYAGEATSIKIGREEAALLEVA